MKKRVVLVLKKKKRRIRTSKTSRSSACKTPLTIAESQVLIRMYQKGRKHSST